VIEGAFSSHKEEAKVSSPFFGNLVKNNLIATTEIKKNYKPVLVIHSREDEVVPFEFGEEIYKSANEPKMFYAIDKGHIMGLQYRAEEISEKISELMLKRKFTK